VNRIVRAWIGGAAALCAAAPLFSAPLSCELVSCAFAQPVPRIKAKVLGFDGKVLRLDPLPGNPAGNAPAGLPASGQPINVSVLPQTRYAIAVPATLSDLKQGGYAGAAASDNNGRLTAQEVFLYPPGLAGTGEGRFTEGDRTMVNGTVTQASTSGFTLSYRGAAESGGVCTGRASPPVIASPLSCTGTAAIAVPEGTPVMALSMGNAGNVSPGVMATVSLARDPQGEYVTPGLVIQKAENVEKPAPAP